MREERRKNRKPNGWRNKLASMIPFFVQRIVKILVEQETCSKM